MKLADRWKEYIDKAYFVFGGFDYPDSKIPFEDFEVTKIEHGSHWKLLKDHIPTIKEDNILITDPDMLIYDKSIIKQGFEQLKDKDCASILDNSGGLDLWKPTKDRGVRRRLAPYMCFIRNKVINGVKDFDFDPISGKYDSMGKITHQLHTKGFTLHEFADDRNTLRLMEDGKMTKDTWLDGPGFKWSEPADQIKTTGYYHVRNSTVGLSLLTEYEHDRPAYETRKAAMPYQEAMRLIAWQWIYDEYTFKLEDWEKTYIPVLKDYKLSKQDFLKYIDAMKKYHPWIKDL